MSFTNEFPRWENEGASPPEAKKDTTGGWEPEEKPPASWFNWFWSRIFKAGEETQEVISSHLLDYMPHLLKNKEANREEIYGWEITEDGHLALIREVKE